MIYSIVWMHIILFSRGMGGVKEKERKKEETEGDSVQDWLDKEQWPVSVSIYHVYSCLSARFLKVFLLVHSNKRIHVSRCQETNFSSQILAFIQS